MTSVRLGAAIFLSDLTIRPAELAIALETRGFDSLFVPEHTHIPTSRRTPYRLGGDLPAQYKRTLDPFVVLAAAASVTDRLLLGTGICLIAQREPIVTAKAVATLDLISNGRVIFGIGAGWNEDEIENHGVDPDARWDLMRENTCAMKSLWHDEIASYQGDRVTVAPSWSWPKPIQQPHPPILLGARPSKKTFQHIVEYCDGWMPHGEQTGVDQPSRLEKDLERLRNLAADAGRDPESIYISVHGGDLAPSSVDHYEALGVHAVVSYLPPAGRDEVLRVLDEWAALLPA